jgi:DnaJ-domain-containing protein 1
MKITTITAARLLNLGDYNNTRIEVSADLEEGEDPGEALRRLRRAIDRQLGIKSKVLEEAERKAEQARWRNEDIRTRLKEIDTHKKGLALLEEQMKDEKDEKAREALASNREHHLRQIRYHERGLENLEVAEQEIAEAQAALAQAQADEALADEGIPF